MPLTARYQTRRPAHRSLLVGVLSAQTVAPVGQTLRLSRRQGFLGCSRSVPRPEPCRPLPRAPSCSSRARRVVAIRSRHRQGGDCGAEDRRRGRGFRARRHGQRQGPRTNDARGLGNRERAHALQHSRGSGHAPMRTSSAAPRRIAQSRLCPIPPSNSTATTNRWCSPDTSPAPNIQARRGHRQRYAKKVVNHAASGRSAPDPARSEIRRCRPHRAFAIRLQLLQPQSGSRRR